MKPRTTPLEKTLKEVFPTHIPWETEIFESRLEELLISDLTEKERLILRLRSHQARTFGDARHLLSKFLRMLLPELFDEKLMAEIAKETLSCRAEDQMPPFAAARIADTKRTLAAVCHWRSRPVRPGYRRRPDGPERLDGAN